MTKNEILNAAAILLDGGLVGLPTETVYGLAADASNVEAVRKIFRAKQRPEDHPLIVHVGTLEQLTDWARDIPDAAFLLAKTFWPGPLTMILRKAPKVHDLITGGQDTVGVRMPDHPVALAVLQAFGGGLAAPSANRFGRISPTTAAAVREELGDAVDLVLEGGRCAVGVESTIIDLSGTQPAILRPGAIAAAEIAAVLQCDVLAAQKNAPRVSGSLALHYAPQTKTRLATHIELQKILAQNVEPIAIMALHELPAANKQITIVAMPHEPRAYAHDLYHTLRMLDKKHFQQIIIETLPEDAAWDAIRDRVRRAVHS